MIPIATYRLQFTGKFGFADAVAIVPYLRALGISHVYASPILKARAGSTHGYDVVDPTLINPELGGDDGFARLVAALRAAGMELIVDFVPNHMAVHHADNPWWLDVLEWGEASPHARAFDIDWQAQNGRVLVPILGGPYEETLKAGDIELRYDPHEGSLSAWYFEHRLPMALPCYPAILRHAVAEAGAVETAAGRALLDLAQAHAARGHPTRDEAADLKSALARIDGGAKIIEDGLRYFRAGPNQPDRTRALHDLLARQAFRLAHWRLAGREINYRRFFDINSLAGLRVEDESVFRDAHARVAALVANGDLDGLRTDHIDGLSDPARYFHRLQEIAARRPKTGDPLCIVAEKILGEDEWLPPFEGVAGTTGYEWLNVISRVLADDRGLPALDRLWQDFSGEKRPFADVLLQAKRDVLSKLFAGEFNALVRLLARIAGGDRTRDLDEPGLRAILEKFILHFPVYRTYVTTAGASEADRAVIDRTIASARKELDDAAAFDFLRDALTLDLVAPGRSSIDVQDFVRKLQQLTGPVMAKALEDTAFYRFHRLLAFSEVGGSPAASGLAVADFHRLIQARMERAPHGLTATATHDTKRGEDARARLLALTEVPDDWAATVGRWREDNARLVRHAGGRRIPSAAHEYMLYQALLGGWPVEGHEFLDRFQAYALKAAREGKVETSWLDPDVEYERGLAGFSDDILKSKSFLQSLDEFAPRIALLGVLNSLTQIALKLAMPGVPDIYQGTELWDLSFVDPDNRRPVDFVARRSVLDALSADLDMAPLAEGARDGRIKLAVLARLLAWRRAHARVFLHGRYQPLAVEGAHRDHVIAFARVHEDEAAILIAARHFAPLTDGGRRWPSPESWQGHVVLDGLALMNPPSDRPNQLALSRAFDPIPVAALSARRVRAGK